MTLNLQVDLSEDYINYRNTEANWSSCWANGVSLIEIYTFQNIEITIWPFKPQNVNKSLESISINSHTKKQWVTLKNRELSWCQFGCHGWQRRLSSWLAGRKWWGSWHHDDFWFSMDKWQVITFWWKSLKKMLETWSSPLMRQDSMSLTKRNPKSSNV